MVEDVFMGQRYGFLEKCILLYKITIQKQLIHEKKPVFLDDLIA
jgi:hypothetical protein